MSNTFLSSYLNFRDEQNKFVTVLPVTLDENIQSRIGNDTTVGKILHRVIDYIEVENKTDMFKLTNTDVRLNTYVFVKDIETLYYVSDLTKLTTDSGYTMVDLSTFKPTISWSSIRNVPTKLSDFVNDGFNADRITSGTLPITRGGTGAGTSREALVNLGVLNSNGGVKIGVNSVNTSNGAAIGLNSETINGGAVGSSSKTTYGGAVGSSALSGTGFAGGSGAYTGVKDTSGNYNNTAGSGAAIGQEATTLEGGAIGRNAKSTSGGAVGDGAESKDGFAGGHGAKATGIGAVQLGEGENTVDHSLKFRDTTIIETVVDKKKLNPSLLRNTTIIYNSLIETGLSSAQLTCAQLMAKVPLQTSLFFTHDSTTQTAYVTDAPATKGIFNFYKGSTNSDAHVKFIDRNGNEFVSSFADGSTQSMSKWAIYTPALMNSMTFTISTDSSVDDTHNSPLLTSKTTFKSIQAILDILPKNLNGNIIYIRIPPRTVVSADEEIIIQNFFNGRIDFIITANEDLTITDPNQFPVINANITIRECSARIVFRKVVIKGRTNGILQTYTNSVVHTAGCSNVVFDIIHIDGAISTSEKIDIGVLSYSSHLVFNSVTIKNCGSYCIRNHNNANYSTMSTVNLVNCRLWDTPTGIYNNAGLFSIENITYQNVTTQTISERGGQFFRQA